MPVQTQLQQRRGTAASWTSTNPTLAAGEIGFETDTGKFKIGDGSTAWASLAYNTNGATASPLTTKGDLYTYSTGNTRLPVGANGETIVADSSTSTGLRYTANFAAGKNKIINGDFNVWQRGTSFSNPAANTYTCDRYQTVYDGSGATRTISRQAFTPGTAPVAGYEGNFFYRINQTVAGTSNTYIDTRQKIEDVTSLAGQTITISFWAKAAATATLTIVVDQDFGGGGSSRVFNAIPSQAVTVTTSWQRFTHTGTMASIAGKTIGTSSYVDIILRTATFGSTVTMDLWGLQVELGSVATAFQTATGTIQGELAACQRYYEKSYNLDVAPGAVSSAGSNLFDNVGGGTRGQTLFAVTKRAAPTVTYYSNATGASGKIRNIVTSTDINAGAAQDIGQTGFGTDQGVIAAGDRGRFQWEASAEL